MAIVVLSRVDGGGDVVLDSNASMPAQGVDVGGELRAVQTWYPGAATPSIQIMGTKESDIVLAGLWRDDLLGEIGGAVALRQQVRALFLAQLECSLQWITDAGESVLSVTGFIKAFRTPYDRADSLRWSLTFMVTATTESQIIAVPAVQPALPFDLADALAALEILASDVQEAATLTNNVLRAVL